MTARRVPLREVQQGLSLAVELGWLFALSAVLGGWIEPLRAAPLLPLPAIAAVLAAATLATRLALGQQARPDLARMVVALLGVGLALLAVTAVLLSASRPDAASELGPLVDSSATSWQAIGTAALVLLAWWRGIVAGRARRSVDTAEAGLRLAVVALAILFLIQAFAPRDERSVGVLAAAALLVLAAGLIAIPLATLLDQRDRSRLEGGRAPRIDAHWLGLLIGAVALVLLLALLLAQMLTFERLDLLLLQPLGTALGSLFWALLYVVVMLVWILADLLIRLLGPLIKPVEWRHMLPPPDRSLFEALREQDGRPALMEGPLLTVLGLVAGAALVALMAWLLARAVFGWGDPRPSDEVEELRDFIWSWNGLWNGLRRRLRRLRPGPHRPRTAVPAQITTEEPPGSPARGVRELYRELLRLGARLGRRRAAYETPYEYERALAALGPLTTGRAEVRRLTDVYIQARYSAASPSAGTVAEARAALERLEALAGADSATPGTRDGPTSPAIPDPG